jgi:hypothetical protein
MIVKISNPSISENIRTNLSQDYTSGTTLNVDSSTSFSSGNYILVGEPGTEKAEITNLTAAPDSSTTLTITSLQFSHPMGTPVYYLRWDKYELSYKTTSAGAWIVYGSMPTALKYDAIATEYRDSSATSTYYWKYRYYSTESATYSDYSDAISASGWEKNSVGYMVRQIRKTANDPESRTITDTEIIRYLNEAQDKIYALYDRWWFLYKRGTVIDTVASQKIYNLPSDFGRMSRVAFRYVSGATDTTYNLKYLSNIEFEYEMRDNNASDDDNVKIYSIYPGDSSNLTGYLHIGPTAETAGLDITPWYYKTMTQLDSFGDTTEVPIPSILEDYALAQIYDIRKEEAKADRYDRIFREQIELLKQMQRKQVGAGRKLWEFKGNNPDDRLFGRKLGNDDSDRENFW